MVSHQRSYGNRFFHGWKTVHSPFQAIISDVDALEIEVCNYIEAVRENKIQSYFESLRGLYLQKELAWLGLLLSILALGAQCSDLPTTLRVSKSREYSKFSFTS